MEICIHYVDAVFTHTQDDGVTKLAIVSEGKVTEVVLFGIQRGAAPIIRHVNSEGSSIAALCAANDFVIAQKHNSI